jgi:hypothetical protein
MNVHDTNSAPLGGGPNLEVSVEFLDKLRPGGPWVLTAILPDTMPGQPPTVTRTVHNAKVIVAFVRKYNGERNIYYSVNPTRHAMDRKAAKTDISAVEYVLADLDPKDGESSEDAKRRYLAAINAGVCPKPTFLVDSGNGLQGLWRIDEPVPLPEPISDVGKGGKTTLVLSGEAKSIIDDIEARIAAVMERLGSAVGTQNIDRILRVPGSMNWPNAAKRAKGRVPCLSTLLDANEGVHGLDAFPLPAAKSKDAKGKAKDKINTGGSKGGSPKKPKIVGVDNLHVSPRIKTIILTGVDPDDECAGRSECVFAVCLALAAVGYDDAQFAIRGDLPRRKVPHQRACSRTGQACRISGPPN